MDLVNEESKNYQLSVSYLKNLHCINWPTQHTTKSDYHDYARKTYWWTFLPLRVLKRECESDLIGLDKISPQETFVYVVCV